MSIRTRLTLWYAGMLFGSLLLLGGLLHHELVVEYERGRAQETPREKVADVLLFYWLPTVLVLVLGGSWFMRRALRPIETLMAGAERVHAGNLAERIPLSGRSDELDRLAEVFNEMLARVEAGVASVRDFTLHASHELKTPLTILSAQAEAALAEPALPPDQRELLESQLEEVRRLAALVDALSLLAKADAGVVRLAQDPIAFDQLVREIIADAEVLAAPQGLTVECPACEPVTVRGDRDRLRQLLLNLVDNAAKYNVPGGTLRIALRRTGSAAELRIANTGPAIPAAALPRVFDRFYRGDNARALRVDGSGLGLSIAQGIAASHGGDINLAPTPDGMTEATLRLPQSPPAPKPTSAPV